MRIALVGCGRVAKHYRTMLADPLLSDVKVVGVVDIDAAKRDDFAKHFGAVATTTVDECIEKSNPDLLVIATPSGLHAEHTRIVLEHDRHVLAEKPAAMLPSEIRSLDALAKKNGLMYGVAFQNRLNPAVRLLREAVSESRFGAVTSLSVRLRWSRDQSYYEDGWHGTWKMDGGVINQQAIHHVDVLQWLFGPITEVSAVIGNRLNKLEAEDTLVAAFRTQMGSLGTIEATTAARPRDFEASLTVTAEGGVARVGGIALNLVEEFDFVSPRNDDAQRARQASIQVPTGYGLSHAPLLREVADRLKNGRTDAPVNAIDSVHTCEVIHALYRSDEVHGWVTVGEQTQSARLGKGKQ
ncbi:MAG: Gfo/Idh/MocA family protein [Ilumatobacteraceae bacterium]